LALRCYSSSPAVSSRAYPVGTRTARGDSGDSSSAVPAPPTRAGPGGASSACDSRLLAISDCASRTYGHSCRRGTGPLRGRIGNRFSVLRGGLGLWGRCLPTASLRAIGAKLRPFCAFLTPRPTPRLTPPRTAAFSKVLLCKELHQEQVRRRVRRGVGEWANRGRFSLSLAPMPCGPNPPVRTRLRVCPASDHRLGDPRGLDGLVRKRQMSREVTGKLPSGQVVQGSFTFARHGDGKAKAILG